MYIYIYIHSTSDCSTQCNIVQHALAAPRGGNDIADVCFDVETEEKLQRYCGCVCPTLK